MGDLPHPLRSRVLLSLNAGFLATLVWVSGESVSFGFVVVPAIVDGVVFGGGAWILADLFER